MKTLLKVLLVAGLGSATCTVWRGNSHGREPHFEEKPHSHWARLLAENPVRHRKVFLRIGPALVPHLVKEIERYVPYKKEVYHAFYCFVYSNSPLLIQAYLSCPISQRERCLHALGLLAELGPEAKDAVPALIPLLGDDYVVTSVVLTLGAIGPEAKAAVPKLIELLDEPQPWVATTLGRIGPGAKDAIPALTRMLTNGVPLFRREAEWALSRIDPVRMASNRPAPNHESVDSETVVPGVASLLTQANNDSRSRFTSVLEAGQWGHISSFDNWFLRWRIQFRGAHGRRSASSTEN